MYVHRNFFFLEKKALGVLDLLLHAEKEGLIDKNGVCEEFLTMITAVNILFFKKSKKFYKIIQTYY